MYSTVPTNFNLQQIINLLAASPLVSSLRVVLTDETARRSIHKIRCQLLRPTDFLEVRLISTEKELLYSYPFFTNKPILRRDNAPHFPRLSNFPHHIHHEGREVVASDLSGNPLADIPLVLNQVESHLNP